MFKFRNTLQWRMTLEIVGIAAIVRTILAYVNPEIFLTYMHVAMTQAFVMAVIISFVIAKLSPLEKRPVLYSACIIAIVATLIIVTDSIARMAILGEVNFPFVLLMAFIAVIAMTVIVAISYYVTHKSKNRN